MNSIFDFQSHYLFVWFSIILAINLIVNNLIDLVKSLMYSGRRSVEVIYSKSKSILNKAMNEFHDRHIHFKCVRNWFSMRVHLALVKGYMPITYRLDDFFTQHAFNEVASMFFVCVTLIGRS